MEREGEVISACECAAFWRPQADSPGGAHEHDLLSTPARDLRP